MMNCIYVGLGGFVGAVGRYLMGLIPIQHKSGFPVMTMLINFIGAFLIGIIAAVAAKEGNHNPQLILFLKTGVCGGFTTFSTFALESSVLLENGKTGVALLYMGLSVAVCLAAVMLGQKLVVG